MVFVVLLGWGVAMGFLLKLDLDKKVVAERLAQYPDRGVPVIEIQLNGTSLEEIGAGSKEVKYEGNELVVINEGEVVEYDNVEVKGRGNGTWLQEKKPYQIKFDEKVDLFGMGRARKWNLLANALDTTNLRTEAAVYLEEMLGMDYVFEGQFVELYIDGDYRGLYYLTRVVEISKDLVDLRDPMGILVELDNVYGWMEDKYYRTGDGDILTISDAVSEDKAGQAMEDFVRNYNEFEVAVAEKDYAKIKELVDVESFAQYYLLSEFIVNPDAYWTSFYMYKDGVNDKIHAGPGWDFDLAFANRNWGNWMGEEFYSPTRTMIRKGELLPLEVYEEMGLVGGEIDWYGGSLSLSRIVFNLMEIPEFQDEVRSIYKERMAGREHELVMRIRRLASEISEAVEVNDGRWGQKELEARTSEMIDWISARYRYFDEIYGEYIDGNVASKVL